MNKVIFEFDNKCYTRKSVEGLDRETCEHLCIADQENVCKFDLKTWNLQDMLNDANFDECHYYRVFIEPND